MGSFFLQVWEKIQGFVAMAVGVLVLIWYVFSRGEKKAKDKAATEKLEDKVIAAETVAKSITDDVKIVTEIEKKIDALPADDLRAHARKWVRDKT